MHSLAARSLSLIFNAPQATAAPCTRRLSSIGDACNWPHLMSFQECGFRGYDHDRDHELRLNMNL